MGEVQFWFQGQNPVRIPQKLNIFIFHIVIVALKWGWEAASSGKLKGGVGRPPHLQSGKGGLHRGVYPPKAMKQTSPSPYIRTPSSQWCKSPDGFTGPGGGGG